MSSTSSISPLLPSSPPPTSASSKEEKKKVEKPTNFNEALLETEKTTGTLVITAGAISVQTLYLSQCYMNEDSRNLVLRTLGKISKTVSPLFNLVFWGMAISGFKSCMGWAKKIRYLSAPSKIKIRSDEQIKKLKPQKRLEALAKRNAALEKQAKISRLTPAQIKSKILQSTLKFYRDLIYAISGVLGVLAALADLGVKALKSAGGALLTAGWAAWLIGSLVSLAANFHALVQAIKKGDSAKVGSALIGIMIDVCYIAMSAITLIGGTAASGGALLAGILCVSIGLTVVKMVYDNHRLKHKEHQKEAHKQTLNKQAALKVQALNNEDFETKQKELQTKKPPRKIKTIVTEFLKPKRKK